MVFSVASTRRRHGYTPWVIVVPWTSSRARFTGGSHIIHRPTDGARAARTNAGAVARGYSDGGYLVTNRSCVALCRRGPALDWCGREGFSRPCDHRVVCAIPRGARRRWEGSRLPTVIALRRVPDASGRLTLVVSLSRSAHVVHPRRLSPALPLRGRRRPVASVRPVPWVRRGWVPFVSIIRIVHRWDKAPTLSPLPSLHRRPRTIIRRGRGVLYRGHEARVVVHIDPGHRQTDPLAHP